MMGGGQRHYLVIGLGSIGQRHVRNLRLLRPEGQISVLRRPTSETITNCGWDRVFYSLNDALEFSPDGAIIASPASTHIAFARALAQHSVPMLIEKPLSTGMEGLDVFQDICRNAAIPVSVGYNLRYHSLFKRASEILESRQLGEVLRVHAEVGQYLPDWRPDRDYRDSASARSELGGGALLELSHELDYLYSLLGMPDAVTCRAGQLSDLELDVEDTAAIILDYIAPHRIVTINLDFLQRPASRNCKFLCAAGTLTIDFITQTVTTHPWSSGTSHVDRVPGTDRNQMYIDELESFLGSVENGKPETASLAEGIAVMTIIVAAKLSLHERRTVTVSEVRPT